MIYGYLQTTPNKILNLCSLPSSLPNYYYFQLLQIKSEIDTEELGRSTMNRPYEDVFIRESRVLVDMVDIGLWRGGCRKLSTLELGVVRPEIIYLVSLPTAIVR